MDFVEFVRGRIELSLERVLASLFSIIAFIVFAVAAVVLERSIFSVLFFILFATYVSLLQTSVTFVWRYGRHIWAMILAFNIVYLTARLAEIIYPHKVGALITLHSNISGFSLRSSKPSSLKDRSTAIEIAVQFIFSVVISIYLYLKMKETCAHVQLPSFLRRHDEALRRFILTAFRSYIDYLCAFAIAVASVNRISPVGVPQLICAVLLCCDISETKKRICCSVVAVYISVQAIMKNSYEIYRGSLVNIAFCDNPSEEAWLYWVGLVTVTARPFNDYIFCLCSFALRAVIIHIDKTWTKRAPALQPDIPFPDVNHKNAGTRTLNTIKFFVNYFFYKFGLEVHSIFWFVSIVVGANAISLLSLCLLMLTVIMERSQIRKLFTYLVVYHVVILFYHYITYIGGLPGKCVADPSSANYLPYLSMLNDGQLTEILQHRSHHLVYFYFFNVMFAIAQYRVFEIELCADENYGGGSNEGVLSGEETSEQNPTLNFYSENATSFIDEIKRMVSLYSHWIVLILEFFNGLRLAAPVFLSVGHVIFAFLNLWRGTDLYLLPMKFYRRKWRIITLYVLASVLLQTAALIAKVALNKFFMVVGDGLESYPYLTYRILNAYFVKPGETTTDSVATYGDHNISDYIFDVIVFAALLLQLRLISSRHFQRTVNDIRTDRIICYRGRILHDQLLLRALPISKQKDGIRLRELKLRTGYSSKAETRFGNYVCESVRGWNRKIFAESEAIRKRKFMAKSTDQLKLTMSLRPIEVNTVNEQKDKDPPTDQKCPMVKKKKYKTISTLISSLALWLGRISLDYRYVRFVLDKEKKSLAQRLRQLKTAEHHEVDVVNEVCLVRNANDIDRYMNEVHNRWMNLPLWRRLIDGFFSIFVARTSSICFVVMILAHTHAGCLLTLPLPFLVFFWGALTPRPTKTLWMVAILYVQLIIMVMMTFKYSFLPWVSNKEIARSISLSTIGRLVGVANERLSNLMYSSLVFALFYNRHSLRRSGFWLGRNVKLHVIKGRETRRNLMATLEEVCFPKFPYPRDYYPYMIMSDLISLVILIFNFSDFDVGSRDVFSLTQGSQLLPDNFLIFFCVCIAEMIVDRVIYLCKAAKMKFVFLILEILVTHVYAFIVLPIIRESERATVLFPRASAGVSLWYIARCCHMLASAYQLRDGYPTFTTAHSMLKENIVNWLIYVGFFFAVPLFELSVIIDWTFTATTLSLFDFYTLETITYYIYFINGLRKFEVFYPRKRGEIVSVWAKLLLGGGIIIGVLTLLVFSLLFISETVFVSVYLPQKLEFTLRISNHPTLYQAHLEDLPTIKDEEWDNLNNYFKNDVRVTAYIKAIGQDSVIDVKLPKESELSYLHSHWEENLIEALENWREPLVMRSRLVATRMHVFERESDHFINKTDAGSFMHAREWQMHLNKESRSYLAQAMKSNDCNKTFSMNITALAPTLLRVPMEGLLTLGPSPNINKKMRGAAYNDNSFKFFTWLEIQADCSSLCETNRLRTQHVPHIVRITQSKLRPNGELLASGLKPRFILFVSRVSTSFFKKFVSRSATSLTMLGFIFYLMSYKVRDIIMTKPYELTFKELGDPSQLKQLCHDILTARNLGLYDLEHDLFGKLVYVLRSSEALICFTRYKMDKVA